MSKSFDYGMICASEQAVIIDEEIKPRFEELMKKYGAYFLNDFEKNMLTKYMFKEDNDLNNEVVGKSPFKIALNSGFTVPEDTKVLVKLLKDENLTCSYPKYKDNWQVQAQSNGILKDLNTNLI